MICTVADFLEQLRQKEAGILAKQAIKHGPTIGDMYEGLTQDLLDRAIPPGLGLDVTSGFITDSSGQLSKQIDCMVVCASGEVVPHTGVRIVAVDDVVAVVEVKKSLYSGDLRSGYQNLASIRPLEADAEGRSVDLLKDAFQSITRYPYPVEEGQLNAYPHEIQLVFHSLAVDLMYPIRIIFGYDGFATENGLRNSFASYLDDVSSGGHAKGFGPARLPFLVCCGNRMLLKCNGMPFHTPIQDDGYWPIYSSLTGNPLEFLLELLWTRLVYEKRFSGSVFEGSSVQTGVHRCLDVKPEQVPDGWGWRYRYVGELPKQGDDGQTETQWEPVIVDETQFLVICETGHEGRINLTDHEFVAFLTERGYTPDGLVNSLNRVGLAARMGDELVLLTRECACVMLPDGRFAAGENSGGQLSRWVEEHYATQTKR